MQRTALISILSALFLSACASLGPRAPSSQSVVVKIIAFNDFHGNLEPPLQSVDGVAADGSTVKLPAGGVSYLGSAIRSLRARNPNSVVVSAGDMIGASPLVSALFLDEPTILAMNLIGVDFNAVGNHEFDRGRAELLRMQRGGCAKYTVREPCRLDPGFPGARFGFLAANTLTEDGIPLFPPYAIKSFGAGGHRVRVAFIGMTLKDTPSVVTPAGVAGLSFRDEADTANALIPSLRAQGVDAIVVLIHQGASTKSGYNDERCEGLEGDLVPILDRLDAAVDLVVSGHTHNAYVCDYGRINPARPFLVTSAGRYGTLVTDITLTIDRKRRGATARAENIIVQGEAFTASGGPVTISPAHPRFARDPAVAALVDRYAAAAAPLAARVVGRLSAPALRTQTASGESVLGNLIADAQLAATRAPNAGGARIAFMNPGGVRADLVPRPGGGVTYGQLFAAQPFANTLVVKSFTGRQIRALLEGQFADPTSPSVLLPSASLRYGYDLSRPAGTRVVDPRVDGAPLADAATYRVTMNSFLASGGDGFTVFRDGTQAVGGAPDIDALENYVAAAKSLVPPRADRVADLTPR